MNSKRGLIILTICLILGGLIFVQASDEMVVEANFIGYDAETIQVDVPDSIFLGNLTIADPFYETNSGEAYIENVGREDVIVTPELISDPENVFQYISFRLLKTSTNESLNEFHSIGDWSIEVEQGESEDFYMSIDLTDFTGVLEEEQITLNSTIRFVAMSAE